MMMRSQRKLRTTTVSRAPHKPERRRWRGPAALVCCAGLLAAIASPHDALAYGVTLNTSSLAGVSGRLEFDLLDLDPLANNSVVISNVVSNGTFVGTECSVGCTGGPPFVIDDTAGFGQLLYDLTLGTSVSFDVSVTTNYGGVQGTDPPDRFVLSLLDPNTNFSLVTTDLSFLSDALLTIDLIGSGVVQTAGNTSPTVAVSVVPEPGSLVLTTIALLALARRRAVAAFRTSIFG